MAEFTEIIKIRDRMHETVKCRDCRLSEKNNGYNCGCHAFAVNHPEEFERICLEWAKQNPEITNVDKLYQIGLLVVSAFTKSQSIKRIADNIENILRDLLELLANIEERQNDNRQ